MSTSTFFGSHGVPVRRWTPRVEVSLDNVGQVPPEELIVDPYLPTLGVDPFDPAGALVIPSGRFVSIGYVGGRASATNFRITSSDTGKSVLTLHEGKNLTPVGMSVNQMYKVPSTEVTPGGALRDAGGFMTESATTRFRRGFLSEVPYVTAVNDAHGAIKSGDYVTGYWGSTTSSSPTAVSPLHRGKPVKWLARQCKINYGTVASGLQGVSAAAYPGITPRLVAAVDLSGAIMLNATVTWAFGNSMWNATATGTTPASAKMLTLIYDYGQDADQIAGELVRIQSLTDIMTRDDFLKWMEYTPKDYFNFPPAMQRYAVTTVTTETPTTVSAGVSYRLVNYPISVYHTVLIEVTNAVLIDKDGTSTTYASGTWFPLPKAVTDMRGNFIGMYHNVNWRTGLIELGANISVDNASLGGGAVGIRASYSYITDPREGAVLWGAGVWNLTDGNSNSAPGTPAHLNISGCTGALRVLVK